MMGRELKRVPLDFAWPVGMVWKGYFCPYTEQRCRACEGLGLNQETMAIYTLASMAQGQFVASLTQEEIDYLRHGTHVFHKLTHEWKDGSWSEKDPPVFVDKKVIEGCDDLDWESYGCQYQIAEFRAKKIGVYGECAVCDGEGVVYFNEDIRQKRKAWYENERYNPPSGEGYQVWETVSEGSPIGPVFATPESCIEWLVEDQGYNRKAAEIFLQKGGCVPSIIKMGDGTFYTNVDCCLVQGGTDGHNS